jgi:hypothetical protein
VVSAIRKQLRRVVAETIPAGAANFPEEMGRDQESFIVTVLSSV